jgi:hypothetical protein
LEADDLPKPLRDRELHLWHLPRLGASEPQLQHMAHPKMGESDCRDGAKRAVVLGHHPQLKLVHLQRHCQLQSNFHQCQLLSRELLQLEPQFAVPVPTVMQLPQ